MTYQLKLSTGNESFLSVDVPYRQYAVGSSKPGTLSSDGL